MPLPLLVPLAIAAGSLAWAKVKQARGITDLDAPPGAPPLPHQWGPGEAPDKPWQADRALPNASACGWHDENGDAHLARWLNHSKRIPLPGDIQNYSPSKLATFLAGFFAQGLAHLGDPKQILASIEVDAKLYGCLSEKILKGIENAPSKIGAFISKTGKDLGSDIVDAASSTGVSVSAGGGQASADIGGTHVSVKW